MPPLICLFGKGKTIAKTFTILIVINSSRSKFTITLIANFLTIYTFKAWLVWIFLLKTGTTEEIWWNFKEFFQYRNIDNLKMLSLKFNKCCYFSLVLEKARQNRYELSLFITKRIVRIIYKTVYYCSPFRKFFDSPTVHYWLICYTITISLHCL